MKRFFIFDYPFIAGILLMIFAEVSPAQKPELVVQSGHIWGAVKVVFSPDGKTLASGSADNTIKLSDVTTGTQLRSFVGHIGWVNSVAFSPDGRTLASASSDGSIKLWDVRSGREERTLSVPAGSSNAVAFSPDGQVLASGWCDRTVKLWNASSGLLLDSLTGPADQVELPSTGSFSLPICVNSVAFSPDGQLVASGTNDGAIDIWEVSRRSLRREFSSSPKPISAVAFSGDGTSLGSCYRK